MKTCQNPDCPDRKSLGIAGEYIVSVENCPRCNALLVATESEPRNDSPAATDQMVLAGVVIGAAQLPLAKSLLEDAGIGFLTRNEITQDLFGWGRFGTGFNPVVGPVQIWVLESSLPEAKALLESIDADAPPEPDLEDDDNA